MTAIKDFLRDRYRGLTSFGKFAHPITDGNEAAVKEAFRTPRLATSDHSREAA
jgi:hypothetical protein